MPSAQLPLPWRWPQRQCFERFLPAPAQTAALAQVRQLAMDSRAPWLRLNGPAGSGKTHLLIAACRQCLDRGGRAQYLPLRRLERQALPAWLPQLPGAALLALDDLDAVAGDPVAEQTLFELYNRLRAEGGRLLLSFSAPAVQAARIVLPDLRSRLGACALARLEPPGEAQRRAILLNEARLRGIVLEPPVLDWLFTHQARDLKQLMVLLERLDSASLAEKRRITIPFLRTLSKAEGYHQDASV